MTNEERHERQRIHALELLRAARDSLQSTSKSRLFGVTRRMLDHAYEKEKTAIDELYQMHTGKAAHSDPTSANTEAKRADNFLDSYPSGSILALDEIGAKMIDYRERGMKIVMTNGCFDLIHRGHVGYLIEARKLGDVLVLGLNSDDSVRRLKGDGRPVLPARDRAEILVALRSVDHVVVFEEDTAENLVDVVRPDVYVKGGDYNPAFPTPEAKRAAIYGGKYHILSYIDGISTSQLIERIAQAKR